MAQMCVPAVLIEIKTGSRLACGNKVANTTRRFRVLPPDKQVSQHFIKTRLDHSRTFGMFDRLLAARQSLQFFCLVFRSSLKVAVT